VESNVSGAESRRIKTNFYCHVSASNYSSDPGRHLRSLIDESMGGTHKLSIVGWQNRSHQNIFDGFVIYMK